VAAGARGAPPDERRAAPPDERRGAPRTSAAPRARLDRRAGDHAVATL